MEDLISIIIPVYNAERYLIECIESILSQSYGNFELILVNDGSKDRSGEICRKYASANPAVRVIEKTNGGVSSARNAGLDAATGKWVVFGDADDFFLPGALDQLAGLTRIGYDIDFGAGSTIEVINGKRYRHSIFTDSVAEHPITHHKEYPLWGNIFRRSIIEEYSLRFVEGISYSEDRIFILEYFLHCRRMASTSRYVYAYRIHPDSACRSKDIVRIAEQQFLAAAEIIKLLGKTTDESSREIISRQAEFVVRMAVEMAAMWRLDFPSLRKIRKLHVGMNIPPLPANYLTFCAVSRLRGLRRKYFPRHE